MSSLLWSLVKIQKGKKRTLSAFSHFCLILLLGRSIVRLGRRFELSFVWDVFFLHILRSG